MKRILGGQLSLGAMPRSYQVTPKVLGQRWATEALPVNPDGRLNTRESAHRQPENQPIRSDDTAQPAATLTVTTLLLRGVALLLCAKGDNAPTTTVA
jgi:hypothetical protein